MAGESFRSAPGVGGELGTALAYGRTAGAAAGDATETGFAARDLELRGAVRVHGFGDVAGDGRGGGMDERGGWVR